jgi:hypothetical protein
VKIAKDVPLTSACLIACGGDRRRVGVEQRAGQRDTAAV